MVRKSRKKSRKRRGGDSVWGGPNGGSCAKLQDKVTKFTDLYSSISEKCKKKAGEHCPKICENFKGSFSNTQQASQPASQPVASQPKKKISGLCKNPQWKKENPTKCGTSFGPAPKPVSAPIASQPKISGLCKNPQWKKENPTKCGQAGGRRKTKRRKNKRKRTKRKRTKHRRTKRKKRRKSRKRQ